MVEEREGAKQRRLRREIYSAYAKAKVCGELGEEYRATALQNWRAVAELSLMLHAPVQEDKEIYSEAQKMLKENDT